MLGEGERRAGGAEKRGKVVKAREKLEKIKNWKMRDGEQRRAACERSQESVGRN